VHIFRKRYIQIRLEGQSSLDPKTFHLKGHKVKIMRLERGEMILLTSHNSLSNVVEALEGKGMEVIVVSGSLKGLRRGRKAKSKGDGRIGGMR